MDDFTENLLKDLSEQTNRSLRQTKELFELCDKNLSKLVELEEKLANNFVFCCPGDKEYVDYVLSMGYGSGYFKIKLLKI